MSSKKTILRRPSRPAPGLKLFATTAAGLEEILAAELRAIGARGVLPADRGVAFAGDLAAVYRANLCLRTAHRVLLELAEFDAPTREALYEGVARIPWGDHLEPDGTLAVDAVSNRSALSHTQFIAQVVKDAVVDGFRARHGRRPSVDREQPRLRINARLHEDRCTLSLDTSGDRLHRRGYRPLLREGAPLKETLAAGILLLSGYDGTSPLVDPMCGSGTLLVEGALIARNIAPGLLGRRFGFMDHPSFDRALWSMVFGEARAKVRKAGEARIAGSDVSEAALRAARIAVRGAGVDDAVSIRRADVADLVPRGDGHVVVNPPYGERLGEMDELGALYGTLGDVLKHRCRGMSAHVFVGSKFLAGRIGLRPKRRDILWNGAIECRLLHFDLY